MDKQKEESFTWAKSKFFRENRENLKPVSKALLTDAIIKVLWEASLESSFDYYDIKKIIELAVNQK